MPQPEFTAYDPEVASKALLPLYETAYKFEIERKDAINSRLSFPIAIFTLIIGAISFFIKDAPEFPSNRMSYWFYPLLFALIVSLGFALHFFSRTLFGYSYAYLRSLGEIDTVARKLKEYNDHVSQSSKRDIGHELTVFLLEQYRSSTDINRHLNIQKSGYFLWTLRSLFVAILFLILSAVPFSISKYGADEKVHKIEVVNLRDQGVRTPTVKEGKIMAEDDKREPTTNEDPKPPDWPEGPQMVEEAEVNPAKEVSKIETGVTETTKNSDKSQ